MKTIGLMVMITVLMSDALALGNRPPKRPTAPTKAQCEYAFKVQGTKRDNAKQEEIRARCRTGREPQPVE